MAISRFSLSNKTRKIGAAALHALADVSKTAMIVSQEVLNQKIDKGKSDSVRDLMPYVSNSLLISTSSQVMSQLAQKKYKGAMWAAVPYISFLLMAAAEHQDDANASILFSVAFLFYAFVGQLGPLEVNTCHELLTNTDTAAGIIAGACFAGFTLSNSPSMFTPESAASDTSRQGPMGSASVSTVWYAVNSGTRCLTSLGTLFNTYHQIEEAREDEAEDHYVGLGNAV